MSMADPARTWFKVGHVTHDAARTGCTVIVFDRLSPAVVDVRGGAPGTRETDLLGQGRMLGRTDAILLTGGSAFGLAAADGVMRFLAEQGRGFATAAGPVPIVPAAVIFDLANGHPVHPGADDGYQAAAGATTADAIAGRIGAGTGATVAKLGGQPKPGGLAIASVEAEDVTITAVVVLNAIGDIREPSTGRWLASAADSQTGRDIALAAASVHVREGENTTIGAVLVSRPVSRDTLHRCCVSAHDALARCVVPAHTVFDGDTFFAASPSETSTDARTTLRISVAAEVAVEQAIVALFAG
jgi:L-aminopeptidase/D-esterase-like protein